MKKTMLILLFAVGIGSGIAYQQYNKTVDTIEDEEAKGFYTAVDLFHQFSSDEVGMDQSLRGKVIEVNGNILEVLTNEDNSQTLLLNADQMIFGVKCRLDPAVNQLPTPLVGETVFLKGVVIGMNADVELNQCILLK